METNFWTIWGRGADHRAPADEMIVNRAVRPALTHTETRESKRAARELPLLNNDLTCLMRLVNADLRESQCEMLYNAMCNRNMDVYGLNDMTAITDLMITLFCAPGSVWRTRHITHHKEVTRPVWSLNQVHALLKHADPKKKDVSMNKMSCGFTMTTTHTGFREGSRDAGCGKGKKRTETFWKRQGRHGTKLHDGGLLVLVRKAWAKDATIVLQTLLAGRILALHFQWCTGAKLTVFICHITAERERTWRNMATILTKAVRGIRSPCVLAGDFNILTDAGDSLSYTGAQNVIHHTADARWWNRCLERFMCASAPWTFRHRASSSFRTLDRFYVNANKTLCHLRGSLVRTFGEGSSPPARGDHWPISLHWPTQSISASRSSGRFASHVHKHPSWQVTLQRYLDCIDTDLPWRAKWAQMQLAFADAAAEIS
eukprot:5150321-Amphidinium_carterae.1